MLSAGSMFPHVTIACDYSLAVGILLLYEVLRLFQFIPMAEMEVR